MFLCLTCLHFPDPRLVDPISAIQQRAAQDLSLVDWSTSTNVTFAAVVAKRGTVCIPVVSSFSGEGTDRNLTLIHNGDEIIKAVADNCDNTIPVIQSVGPVDMEVCILNSISRGPKLSLTILSSEKKSSGLTIPISLPLFGQILVARNLAQPS